VELHHVTFSFAFLLLSEQGGWLLLFMRRFGCVSHNFTCQIKKKGIYSDSGYTVCFKVLFKLVVHCILSHFCSTKWSWIIKVAKRLLSKWSSLSKESNKNIFKGLVLYEWRTDWPCIFWWCCFRCFKRSCGF